MMVLFVCHANLNRSPRAAEVFQKLADQKGFAVEVQSAGTNAYLEDDNPQHLNETFGIDHVTQLTSELLEKADVVVALDIWVTQQIKMEHQFVPKEKIITLGIPDNYSKRENNLDALYEILNKKLEPLAEEISLSQRRRPNKEIF
jgi:protein-tyrosine-phosphatase